MPTVLHIDGLSAEPIDHFEVKAGESLKDVLDRTGARWRLKTVPDEPREIGPKAAAFIASYKREDPSAVLAIFWRYHSLEAEEFDTAEEAKRFIESGEEYESLAGEAVVDGDQITVLD